jgi:hypothetical protein
MLILIAGVVFILFGLGNTSSSQSCLSIGVLLAILGGVILFLSNRSLNRLKPIYAHNKAVWNVAMQRWNDLYYCSRDDIVFDPATSVYAPVEEMMGFLYRDMKQQ